MHFKVKQGQSESVYLCYGLGVVVVIFFVCLFVCFLYVNKCKE